MLILTSFISSVLGPKTSAIPSNRAIAAGMLGLQR